MKRVELVFRSVGERTSELALELARRNLQPSRVHVTHGVRPFWKAFEQNLALNFDCDYVVFLDADSLILEDMRPFLDSLTDPYVDCYVVDKFRGRLHAGVHITRRDVIEAMRQQNVNRDDPNYLLRPESYTRMFALRAMKADKTIRNFRILHDFGQSYEDIFAKYMLRELRSRSAFERARLDVCTAQWPIGDGDAPDDNEDQDFRVARAAIDHARRSWPVENGGAEPHSLVPRLPKIAREQVARMGLREKRPATHEEVDSYTDDVGVQAQLDLSRKIFCIGLSRTGTKSVTRALNVLGYVMVHYPTDPVTYMELSGGNYQLTLLNHLDGITDITVAPFYRELDRLYPGSKFVLTLRGNKDSWLQSLERHWEGKPIYDDIPDQEDELRMKRFLRAAVYGTLQFSRERLSSVYDLHTAAVMDYFRDRPNDLLVMDVTAGDGWDALCPFLGKPVPLGAPFPNVQTKQKLREMLSRAV